MSGFYKIFLKNENARSSANKQKKLAQSVFFSSDPVISSSELSPLANNSSKKVKHKPKKLNMEELNSIQCYMSYAVRNSSQKLYEPHWIKIQKFCSESNLTVSSSESISLQLGQPSSFISSCHVLVKNFLLTVLWCQE